MVINPGCRSSTDHCQFEERFPKRHATVSAARVICYEFAAAARRIWIPDTKEA
jgi:hypothetical protein